MIKAAVVLLLMPLAFATIGAGENYSVGSATISMTGGKGAGDTYSSQARLDFRPVGVGNGSSFELHEGLWNISPVYPELACNNIYQFESPDEPKDDSVVYLAGALGVLCIGAVGYNRYKRSGENGNGG